MKKNKEKTPIRLIPYLDIGYKPAIVILTILLLFAQCIISAGFVINQFRMVRLWREREQADFRNLGESAGLLMETLLSEELRGGRFSKQSLETIQARLRRFQLDIRDRIYLVTLSDIYLVFPERPDIYDSDVSTKSSKIESAWLPGWQGKSGITAAYMSDGNRKVKAMIRPIPPGSREPDYLVIIERETAFEDQIDHVKNLLLFFLMFGLIGITVVLSVYAVAIFRPFRALEVIIARFENESTQGIGLSNISDPVNAAVMMFEESMKALKEKEGQLEQMNALMERQTQASETFTDNILSRVDTGIIVFSQDRLISSMTGRIKSLLNISMEKVTGRFCGDVFGHESIINTLLTDALVKNKFYEKRQWKWELPGEPSRWISISTHGIPSGTDSITGVTMIVRDITQRKLLEHQIREQEHLAALGELSAGIAHEIRNPLGVIKGNADLLNEDLVETDHQVLIQDILAEVVNLDRIIRDFLRFARPTSPDVDWVDIGSLLRDLQESYSQTVSSDVVIELAIEDHLPRIQIDEGLIRQVIQNLIDNALDAVGSSGRVMISGKTEFSKTDPDHDVADGFVLITIEDNGKGISPEDFDELFKPFFTRRPNGTGLGLAIAKKLIVYHKGTIEFDRTIIRGAAVKIRLPIRFDPDRTLNLKRKSL